MLASDANNPEFIGAFNPDDTLAVQFYIKPMPNEFRTNQEGRPIWEDILFVKIFTPGNDLNIIDTPAREEHKARFPRQWAHFQNTHGDDSREIGTPLKQWPLVTPAQVEELRAMKFFTVENIANSSDQQINRLGMIAGMSPFAFRERAQRFLMIAHDDSVANRQANELAELKAAQEKKDAEHTAELLALKEQLDALTHAMADKPKRGRPAKTVEG